MDPLKIDKVDIQQGGQGPVNLMISFSSLNILGLSKAQLKSVTGLSRNFDGEKIDIKGHVPIMNMIGNSKLSGRVLVLPITGDGQANITFVSTNIAIRIIPRTYVKDGKEYARVEKVKTKLSPQR